MNEVATTQETQHELAIAGATAEKQHEIQSAIVSARKFPRNEDLCFQKLMKACSRPSFAEDARYSFPRAGTEVTGPSVNLAREAARIWGNIRFGLYIVREDHETLLIRGWAWDVETNTKVEHDDNFKKLIYRKQGGWLTPDERDLRELVNRRGAILVRNSLLQVMPKDLIEDALFACRQALQQSAKENPDAARKKLLVDFNSINITVEHLEKRLGHPYAQSTPDELSELRGIYKSIADGNSKWNDYGTTPDNVTSEGPMTLKGRLKQQVQPLSVPSEGEGASGTEEAPSSPVETPDAPQNPPDQIWKDRLTNAPDSKTVNKIWREIPEDLKPDCYKHYSDVLKSLRGK